MKRIACLVTLLLAFSLGALAQGVPAQIVTPADQKFGPIPNFPACMKGAVLHGDPSSPNGVVLIGKGTAGCKVPWHWHTPNEQVGIISGTARLAMKGEQGKTLAAGSYAYLPSKHQHEFTCVTACSLFAASDNVFDIHYVDAGGAEITPEQALGKPAGKKAAPKKK